MRLILVNRIHDGSEFARIRDCGNEASVTQSKVRTSVYILATYSSNHINGVQWNIGLLIPRTAHLIAAISAAWRADLYLLPLRPAWPSQKSLDLINRIQMRAVPGDDGGDQAVLKVAA